MSNAPTVLLGGLPLVRAVVQSATDAAATTVTADDSGTLFVNLSTSEHTYTLPTVTLSAGKSYIFLDAETTAATVVTSGSASLVMGGNDGNLATTLTDGGVAGSWCLFVCDGTYYYGLCGTGTWTAS